MKRLMLKIIRWIKARLDHLSGRMLISSMFLIARSERLPVVLYKAVKWIVYIGNDLALLLKDFPLINAYKYTSDGWAVVLVGNDAGSLFHIRDLIFQGKEVVIQPLPRDKVWQLSKQCTLWLENGADLVVCELSRLFPWKPSATYAFTGPRGINQVLDLPDSPDDLLIGSRNHGPRSRIRQAEKRGLYYRFTNSQEELEYFYYAMYLPYVRSRHGEKAFISSLEDHKRWLELGGLILVYEDGKPIAGSLVIQSKQMCHDIESGILSIDPGSLKSGANAFLVWSKIRWAHSLGAVQLDLGGSSPWCSNGSYKAKARWGARTVKHWLNSQPTLTFLSDRLPDLLRERLNQIGMISEIKGKLYCVYIPANNEESLDGRIQEALRNGVDGIAMILPGSVKPLVTHALSGN